LDGNLTVFETVDYVAQGDIRTKIRDILGAFMFGGEASEKKVRILSGGERSRLAMIRLLLEPVNLLILDEPTNHLDMRSKDVLKAALKEFDGTLIVVSHDRYFRDKVGDHLLVVEGDAKRKDFPGNYTQYRDWRELQQKQERKEEKVEKQKQEDTRKSNKQAANEGIRKMTFKEKQEFEAIEKEIEQLEAEKETIETNLSNGTLSNDELIAQSNRISIIIDLLDEKTMRWLELSELKS
jgi:ATP-binding cassette subfamily F protein uup